MAEQKFVKDPGRKVRVLDENHQPVDLHLYLGMRVKRGYRRGDGVLAILAGPVRHAKGMVLFFESREDYEDCVDRVWCASTHPPEGPD